MSSTFQDITRNTPLEHYLIVYFSDFNHFGVIRRQWLLSDTQAYSYAVRGNKSRTALQNHVDYDIGSKDWAIFNISVNIMKSDAAGGICVPLIYDNLKAALQGWRNIWTKTSKSIEEFKHSVVKKQSCVAVMQVNWTTLSFNSSPLKVRTCKRVHVPITKFIW
jgi:hypothetical protein